MSDNRIASFLNEAGRGESGLFKEVSMVSARSLRKFQKQVF